MGLAKPLYAKRTLVSLSWEVKWSGPKIQTSNHEAISSQSNLIHTTSINTSSNNGWVIIRTRISSASWRFSPRSLPTRQPKMNLVKTPKLTQVGIRIACGKRYMSRWYQAHLVRKCRWRLIKSLPSKMAASLSTRNRAGWLTVASQLGNIRQTASFRGWVHTKPSRRRYPCSSRATLMESISVG